MGKTYEAIPERLADFIERQKMFFVATAPKADEGLVNLSPKGLESFRILGPTTVAYLDLTGSGIETVAHLKENGRIVIMFCAFEGAPNIVRLQGRGEVIEPGHAEFETLVKEFPEYDGTRSVIRVECTRISDSCGYGVPKYEYVGQRTQLTAYTDKVGPEKMAQYRREHNARSLDGLPGLAITEE